MEVLFFSSDIFPITQLEEMKNLITLRMGLHFDKLNQDLEIFLENEWDDVINKATKDGIAKIATGYSKEAMEAVLTKPWAADGMTFSKRIWEDRKKLSRRLQDQLEQSIMVGKNPKEIIKDLSVVTAKKKSDIARLVYTEHAYVASEADKLTWDAMGLEKYQISAVIDAKTSDICRAMDGKIFDMKNRRVGITAPPFHPYCRTVTVPWFDELEEDDKPYEDVTHEWQPVKHSPYQEARELQAWTHEGKTYQVAGKYVTLDYSEHEKTIADILAKDYGKDVAMVPRVSFPLGVPTPDYLIDGEKWDLKTLTGQGKNTVYDAIKKKKKQSSKFIIGVLFWQNVHCVWKLLKNVPKYRF